MGSYLHAQEIDPSPEGYGKTVTMGEYIRDVFLEQVGLFLGYKLLKVCFTSSHHFWLRLVPRKRGFRGRN